MQEEDLPPLMGPAPATTRRNAIPDLFVGVPVSPARSARSAALSGARGSMTSTDGLSAPSSPKILSPNLQRRKPRWMDEEDSEASGPAHPVLGRQPTKNWHEHSKGVLGVLSEIGAEEVKSSFASVAKTALSVARLAQRWKRRAAVGKIVFDPATGTSRRRSSFDGAAVDGAEEASANSQILPGESPAPIPEEDDAASEAPSERSALRRKSLISARSSPVFSSKSPALKKLRDRIKHRLRMTVMDLKEGPQDMAHGKLTHAFTMDSLLSVGSMLARGLAKKYGIPIDEVDDIKAKFDEFDLDGSGVIEFDEFRQLMLKLFEVKNPSDMPEPRIQFFWNSLDTDGGGDADFEEFLVWYRKWLWVPQDEQSRGKKKGKKKTDGMLEHYYRSVRTTTPRF
mmetsp:Transcript_2280/g.5240  ORF Transcript_2280/g.5240 Transcript_2280/m.5240 type:complete len:397 (+) Transcript_2280:2-1192(+)